MLLYMYNALAHKELLFVCKHIQQTSLNYDLKYSLSLLNNSTTSSFVYAYLHVGHINNMLVI